MPKPFALLPLIGFALSCAVEPACAAERSATLAGSRLFVDSPSARAVEIRLDPSLHGEIAVLATADRQEELDRLLFDTDGQVRIHTKPHANWQFLAGDDSKRTLRITVRVPAGLPIAIDEGGAGTYTVADVGGPLELDISGAASIGAGRSASLDADLSGAGSVHVAAVSGTADIDISGSGNVDIGAADLERLTAGISGAGSLTIDTGRISKVDVDDSGFDSMRIGAAAGDAVVDISGVGSVHLAHVAGSLAKDVSGVGSVTVGN